MLRVNSSLTARSIQVFQVQVISIPGGESGKASMNGLSQRLDVVQRDLTDQADYVQHLLEQFDVAYDACCDLQMTVADLRSLSARVRSVMANLPKPRKRVRCKAGKKREE